MRTITKWAFLATMTACIAAATTPPSASAKGALGGPSPNIALMVGSGPGCQFVSLQSAIDFAATQPGADTVVATRSRSYDTIALTIADGADLTLMGGFDGCLGTRDRVATELDGEGGVAAPVIRHTGSGALNLIDLTLVGGDAINAGGGLDSTGSGALRLENVGLHSNRGVAGGGLAAIGADAASPKTVRLAGEVSVIGNVADAGGGLFLMNARVIPEAQPGLMVWENVAEAGDGGGLYLLNADIQSPAAGSGFGCHLRILDNRASDRGGGLFVHVRGAEREIALRVARDCMGWINYNRAGIEGGGVHVFADASVDAPPDSSSRIELELLGFMLLGNRAPDGAALMQRSTQDALRFATSFVRIAPEDFGKAQRSRCDGEPVAVCSQIEENAALNADGSPSKGAVIALRVAGGIHPSTALQIANTALIDNLGTQVLRAHGRDTTILLADSLVNGPGGDTVLMADEDARGLVLRSTIVFPGLEGHAVLIGDRRFLLEGSIVIVPQRHVLCMTRESNEARVSDLMYDFLPPLPAPCTAAETVMNTLTVTDPGFVDPDLGDFHLRPDSEAIDRHEIEDVDQIGALDLDLNPRGLDDRAQPNVPNHLWDLGAFESGRLFSDGYEGGG